MKRAAALALFFVVFFCFYGPARAEEESWKFVVVGDTRGEDRGINQPIVSELADAIIAEEPAFVLVPGDLVRGGGDRKTLGQQFVTWRRHFMDPLTEKGIRVYPVRGNHDLPGDDSGAKAWLDVFAQGLPGDGPADAKKLDYSFVYRNAVVIGLDLYIPGREHGADREWLGRSLVQRPGSHVFVFAHEPLFALAGRNAHGDGIAARPEERDRLAGELAGAGCLVYFCGHDHWYNRSVVEVLPRKFLIQVIAGTGGAPLREWSGSYRDRRSQRGAHIEKYGYLVVEVNGRRARGVMKGRTGEGMYAQMDSFSYVLPAQ